MDDAARLSPFDPDQPIGSIRLQPDVHEPKGTVGTEILRVPGGWIVRTLYKQGVAQTFVPLPDPVGRG